MADTTLKFPHKIEDLDPETNAEISRNFSGGLNHLVQVGPQKMLIPSEFSDECDNYYNFKFRKGDVIVVGYPRSGTTMTQEMVWLMLNNFDLKKALDTSLIVRVPLLEARSLTTKETIAAVSATNQGAEKLRLYRSSIEILRANPGRRVIKTHLHFNFLPPDLLNCGCKIIYVARNPKDVVVSLYHLQRTSQGRQYTGDISTFLDYFVSDLTLFAPYWAHLSQGWERRHSPNVHFIFYEDFIQNRRHHIKTIADFINQKLTTEQVELLEDTLEFSHFKKYMSRGVDRDMNTRQDVNDDFIRKGEIGGWKEYFTEEMNQKMDKWVKENVARIGIEFPLEF
ncbi:sulfotransferase 1C4 [Tribolium castaneum]|uniref:sulfotransferase 1C4 n=1 Tax=Tribolium castaneum TaxID=7070 RepID=UPI0030FF3BAC